MKTPPPDPSQHPFFQQIENMREVLRQGQALSAHLQQPPDWPLHLRRLDEIERLFRSGTVEDLRSAVALHEDFLLDMNADMARTVAEVSGRMVRVVDEVARRVEEKKFELPSEVRDDMEDLLQPYHDGLREKMLSEMPLEERRKIEGTEGPPDEPR